MAVPTQPISFVNKWGVAIREPSTIQVAARTIAVGFTMTDTEAQYQLINSTAAGAEITIVLPAAAASKGMTFCFREVSGTGGNTLALDSGGTIATCDPGKVAMVICDPSSGAWVSLFVQA
jgi:hypothetical protein